MNLKVLKARLSGKLVLPEENGKSGMPSYWMPFRKHSPQVPVVYASNIRDVQLAVEFAAYDGRRVVVSTTGHGTAAVTDPHSLLLVPRFDDEVEVYPIAQKAWFPGGTTWGKANAATLPYGLVGLHGSTTNVAAMGGYTFFGGIGAVTRKFGVAADTLLQMDIVTSDGGLVQADPSNNPDLFWAMAGGGASNFGVVVGMELQLHRVVPVHMVGLMYMLGSKPEEEAIEFLERFRKWCESVPRELMAVIALKPRAGLDEGTYYIKPHILVEFYWCGDPSQALTQAEYWTKWRKPRSQWWLELPDNFDEVGISPFRTPATMAGGHGFCSLSDEVLEVAARYGTQKDLGLTNFIVRHVGGAMQDREDCNALPIRPACFLTSVYADVLDEAGAEAYSATVRGIHAELDSYVTGMYVNYMRPDEIPDYYPSAFRGGGKYERLCQIKQTYDPNGLFCGGGMPPINHGIA